MARTYGQAARGLWPRQYEIAQGTYLYRFIDLGRMPAAAAADGPWWLEYEHFQTIRHFAERHGYALGYAARLFAAILYEWSEVNVVVRARVTRGPLLAWKGKGKQVEARNSDPHDVSALHGLMSAAPTPARRMTPMQGSLEVLQLYIAGLGIPHCQFSSFMHLDSVQPIATG